MITNISMISITNIKSLKKALTIRSVNVILLANCHIGNLDMLVNECHKSEKKVAVNLELIGGFTADQIGIKLLKDKFNIDYVISNSPSRLSWAQKAGLATIQLLTLIDSRSIDSVKKIIVSSPASLFEVRPAAYAMQFIKEFKEIRQDAEFLIGGFVCSNELLKDALKAGFVGATSSDLTIW